MRKLLLLLFSLFLISSCTIQERIYFNKDFSGKFSYQLNIDQFEQFASIFSALDTSQRKSEKDDQDVKNMLKNMMDSIRGTKEFSNPELLNIEGISNFVFDKSKGDAIAFSFEFKNIEALNKAYLLMRNSGSMKASKHPDNANTFVKKGNGIRYTPPKLEALSEEAEKEQGGASLKEQLKILNSFTFETSIFFEQGVKKVKAKDLAYELKGDDLVIRAGIGDLMDKEKSPIATVRLK